MNQWDERAELAEERAELLPDRTTLAAVDLGRKEFSPTTASVGSPTASNFPIGSPSSNGAIVSPAAATQVSGGFMPIVITLMPSINIVVQQTNTDALDTGHHSGTGDTPVGVGHAQPTAAPIGGGNGWMDFLRWLFGR